MLAINQAIDTNILAGNFSAQAAQVFIPRDRPAQLCAAYLAAFEPAIPDGTLPPLTVTDMAGLFIVQAVGICLALLYHQLKLVQRRLKRRRRDSMPLFKTGSVAPGAEAADVPKCLTPELLGPPTDTSET